MVSVEAFGQVKRWIRLGVSIVMRSYSVESKLSQVAWHNVDGGWLMTENQMAPVFCVCAASWQSRKLLGGN